MTKTQPIQEEILKKKKLNLADRYLIVFVIYMLGDECDASGYPKKLLPNVKNVKKRRYQYQCEYEKKV